MLNKFRYTEYTNTILSYMYHVCIMLNNEPLLDYIYKTYLRANFVDIIIKHIFKGQTGRRNNNEILIKVYFVLNYIILFILDFDYNIYLPAIPQEI